MEGVFAELHKSLQHSVILTEQDDGFNTALQRWSDINIQVPAAIIQPTSEVDIIQTIKIASKAGIPFVPSCGGHSTYSTVKGGVIIDLQRYKEIVVDASKNLVTVKGGVLMKEFQVALSKEDQITAVANANTVGVIPFFIGGGIHSYAPMIGFACENIVSAKIITTDGELLEATEDQNSDLLWAVRGAGQHFGLVIELVIRTYPKSLISPDASRQMGTYIFGVDQAAAVCQAISKIISDADHVSVGQIIIATSPQAPQQQVLLVLPQFFGSSEEMAKVFKPLIDLGPMMQRQVKSTFETHSDHLAYLCDKGDFKWFSKIGLSEFSPGHFVKLIDLHRELLSSHPGCERSSFSFEWHTHTHSEYVQDMDTSFGNKGVEYWLNTILWFPDSSKHEAILKYDYGARKEMRANTEEAAYISYTNSNRDDPVEHRYKGAHRLSKLKALKKKWDPKGAFTKEFL